MCGEHYAYDSADITGMGSSPRVRGTLDQARVDELDFGIIPACAGNTSSTCPAATPTGDHPRVCGEHARFDAFGILSAGSSPRVRGTPEYARKGGFYRGIIPACAGNTPRDTFCGVMDGDHPRVCGEHLRRSSGWIPCRGSSPRVRGTQRQS